MNHCTNCRHWKRDGDIKRIWGKHTNHVSVPTAHRLCSAVPTGNGPLGDIDPEHIDAMALVFDFEDYKAELWTLPTFGCVLFEEEPSNG